jgi:hypothetical protein
MPGDRTSEIDLVQPALQLLARHGPLETSELARLLRAIVRPHAVDLEILPSRKDDRLSQVIRNLISHRTLSRRGLATYERDPVSGKATYRLTELGAASIQTYS